MSNTVGMKFAGIYKQSDGYPLDDPPMMVWAAIDDVLFHCRANGIAPVGAFEMSMADSMPSFPDDVALRWEFTPDVEP